MQSDYYQAQEYYMKALGISEEIGDVDGIQRDLGNLGLIYDALADYPRALETYQKALLIAEEQGDSMSAARHLGNMGSLYVIQELYDKAYEVYSKSLEMNIKMHNLSGQANAYGNLGFYYRNLKDYKKAEEHYEIALGLYRKIQDKSGMAINYGNLANLYRTDELYDKSYSYISNALAINRDLGIETSIGHNLGNLGKLYIKLAQDSLRHEKTSNFLFLQKNDILFQMAIGYINQAVEIHEKLGNQSVLISWYSDLVEAYSGIGNYKKALEYHQKFHELNEVVFDRNKAKEIGMLEAKREADLRKRELEFREHERLRFANLQYLVIVIGIFILLVAMLLLVRVNVTRGFLKGLIFLNFILLFEFLLILLDPYIEVLSDRQPILVFAANFVLALIVFPIHQFIHGFAEKRLLKD